jgi:hypothetical protein
MTTRRWLLLVLGMNLIVASSCNRDEGRRGERLIGERDSEGVNVTQTVVTDPTQISPTLESSPSPTPLVNRDPEPTVNVGDPVSSPTPNPIEPLLDELDEILAEIDVVLGSEATWQIDLP